MVIDDATAIAAESRLTLAQPDTRQSCEWRWQPRTGWQDPAGLAWWEHLTGHQVHIAGWSWLDVVHPADRPAAEATWNASIRQGTSCSFDYRARRRDGAWVWVNADASPIRNDAGDVTEWIGTVSEITAARRGERAAQLETLVVCAVREANGLPQDPRPLLTGSAALSGAACAALWRVEDGRFRCIAAAPGWQDDCLECFAQGMTGTSIAMSDSISGFACAAEAPVWIDVLTSEASFPSRHTALAAGLRSALAIQLRRGVVFLGILELLFDAPAQTDRILLAAGTRVGLALARHAAPPPAESPRRPLTRDC